jgi:hypothetical protein
MTFLYALGQITATRTELIVQCQVVDQTNRALIITMTMTTPTSHSLIGGHEKK